MSLPITWMTGIDPTRLVIPLVAVMAVALIYSSRLTTGKPKETPEGLVFAVKPIYLWSRTIFLPLYMAFFLWIGWHQNHVVPWPIFGLCLVALGIVMLQMPGTITLTPTAVTQRFWLQPEKIISYGEVITIQALQIGRTILVLGDNRVRIRHSANHVAPADFRREIERRTDRHVIT
jgi:hypothetical protein